MSTYYELHREERKTYMREHRKALGVAAVRSLVRQQVARWRLENPDREKDNKREYYSQPTNAVSRWLNRVTRSYGMSGRNKGGGGWFMLAVTGLTKPGFAAMFPLGDGLVIDHRVPLCAFDLTNPEHLVRATWVSNLQVIGNKENAYKSDSGRDVEVMTLPWIGSEDAMMAARIAIRRICQNALARDYASDSEAKPRDIL